ncbi:MAG: hypothetical protein ABIA63_08430, partial [bacterium]
KRKIKKLEQISRYFTFEKSDKWETAVEFAVNTDKRKGRNPGPFNGKNILKIVKSLGNRLNLYTIRDMNTNNHYGFRAVLRDYNKRALDFLAGMVPHPEFDHLNRYMMARILETKANEGFKTYDFNGCYEENVARFKEKFNGTLAPFFSIHYSRPFFLRMVYEWNKVKQNISW